MSINSDHWLDISTDSYQFLIIDLNSSYSYSYSFYIIQK
jgi:hypothetical protein